MTAMISRARRRPNCVLFQRIVEAEMPSDSSKAMSVGSALQESHGRKF